MRTASEVAKDKFYKLIACHLDESCGTSHRIKIINGLAVTLTAFRNEGLDEALKIVEKKYAECSDSCLSEAEQEIRALKK